MGLIWSAPACSPIPVHGAGTSLRKAPSPSRSPKSKSGHSQGPVQVGNLDSVRTLADVRDVVRAYRLLLDGCPGGEVYNIGGKATMTIGEILET